MAVVAVVVVMLRLWKKEAKGNEEEVVVVGQRRWKKEAKGNVVVVVHVVAVVAVVVRKNNYKYSI